MSQYKIYLAQVGQQREQWVLKGLHDDLEDVVNHVLGLAQGIVGTSVQTELELGKPVHVATASDSSLIVLEKVLEEKDVPKSLVSSPFMDPLVHDIAHGQPGKFVNHAQTDRATFIEHVPNKCAKCEGTGSIEMANGRYKTGYTMIRYTCPSCDGTGRK